VIDWTANTNKGTDRGYTGHEQLDDIGMVHMNGRLFDSRLGRFLQGDPLVQDPANLQNYNRYGYCFNNPMGCTDPSGFGFTDSLKWLDPAGYAAHKQMTRSTIGRVYIQIEIYVGSGFCGPWFAVCYGAGQAVNASISGYSDSQALKVGLISGATAQLNSYIGSNYSGVANVAAHAVVGCASAEAGGGSCRDGAVGAAIGSAYDQSGLTYTGQYAEVVNFVISSSVGGVASLASGGGFSDGARQAAYSYLFNCLAHECFAQGRDAESTFVDYLKSSGKRDEAGLDFNKWSDGENNFLGRPDIFSSGLAMVWDVKPDSIYGWGSGVEQIARYTSVSGYGAGTAGPLFGNQASITLRGSMNRYEYRFGGNGLVIYRALDASPMERVMHQYFMMHSTAKRDGPAPTSAPMPMPAPFVIP
jgi:RHS repeat-associated protein